MNVDAELLRVLEHIAKALEEIAENTKPEKVKEREHKVKGFNPGGTD